MKPHKNMGPDYLHRWHLIPKNRRFNIFLHRVLASDDARALHDHPWWSLSFLLKGDLWEIYESRYGLGEIVRKLQRFRPVFREATHTHRLVLKSGEAWTIFITGRRRRDWGFWVNGLWMSAEKYSILMRKEK